MNKATLIGRLGQDPEIKYASSGTAIVNVSLATTERVKGENKTEWHRLVAFGKTAEIMGQYLSKGSQVGIEGRLQTRSWEKDGQKRYSTEIVVDRLEFLDSKQKKEDYPQPDHSQFADSDDGSDIPF